MASLYPLSARQLGQVLVKASVPEYQTFTQASHPKIVLQHLVAMIGGFSEP